MAEASSWLPPLGKTAAKYSILFGFAFLRNFAGSGACLRAFFLLLSLQPCCSADVSVVNSVDRHPRVTGKSSLARHVEDDLAAGCVRSILRQEWTNVSDAERLGFDCRQGRTPAIQGRRVYCAQGQADAWGLHASQRDGGGTVAARESSRDWAGGDMRGNLVHRRTTGDGGRDCEGGGGGLLSGSANGTRVVRTVSASGLTLLPVAGFEPVAAAA